MFFLINYFCSRIKSDGDWRKFQGTANKNRHFSLKSGNGNHRFFLSLHLEGNFIQFIDHSIVNHCSCPAAFWSVGSAAILICQFNLWSAGSAAIFDRPVQLPIFICQNWQIKLSCRFRQLILICQNRRIFFFKKKQSFYL